ncbi:MAG: bile acid:sodium symporter [Puia sp.]|nr:bile acid:sodium symporter [Puia sp.]
MYSAVSVSFNKASKTLKRFGLDGFILSLIGMIVLASLYPAGGMRGRFLSLPDIANYGVSLVFFFYGLRLSRSRLTAGLSNWRLHLVVHGSTFILFPLLLLSVKGFFVHTSIEVLWLGCFFLASLPSTVSSSVVMVSIAGGNIPAAIFNASISSIIGVFITPLWMQLVTKPVPGESNLGQIILKLVLQVLVPVTSGLLLNSRWGWFAGKYRKQLKYLDQLIILLIVYTAFCESFARHLFSSLGWSQLFILGGCMLGLFFFVYSLVSLACRLLRFNREDRITAVFCGSKKSLVHGSVMVKVLFSNSGFMGILLLPLMLYHALQLISASIIAQKMAAARQKEEQNSLPFDRVKKDGKP